MLNELLFAAKNKEIVADKIKELVIEYAMDESYVVNVCHEETEYFHFVYFEVLIPGHYLKRYFQMVYSSMFLNRPYFDSNAIDNGYSYSIEELKRKFKNYLTSLLDKMQ